MDDRNHYLSGVMVSLMVILILNSIRHLIGNSTPCSVLYGIGMGLAGTVLAFNAYGFFRMGKP